MTSLAFLTPISSSSVLQPLEQRLTVCTHVDLPLKESIQLLTDCIRGGDSEVKKAQHKKIVLVLGNTGSGKSSTINYLAGCKMVGVLPKTVGAVGSYARVDVSPRSPITPLVKIGHTEKSETFVPHVQVDLNTGITYCDFPGFFDNRGPEINAANAVNIKRIIEAATSIKIILLIQHTSLIATRQRNLDQMLEIIGNLFGQHHFKEHAASIRIGITRMASDESLEDLHYYFFSAEKRFGIDFSKLLFICDPLKKHRERLNRKKIIKEILKLPGITTSRYLFNVALTPAEQAKIFNIGFEAIAKITAGIENNVSEIANIFEYLNKLRVIDHTTIGKIVQDATAHLDRQFVLSKKEEKGFSTTAPKWRIIFPGLNIESKCETVLCEAFDKYVWTNMTSRCGLIDLNTEVQKVFCPQCTRKTSRTLSIGFYRCSYSFAGQSPLEKEKLGEEFSALNPSGFAQYKWNEILQMKRFLTVCVKI